jgi:hypothetical protein
MQMMSDEIRRFLSEIGTRGGESGRGAAERRGSSDYYKRLSAKAAKARAKKRQSLKARSAI